MLLQIMQRQYRPRPLQDPTDRRFITAASASTEASSGEDDQGEQSAASMAWDLYLLGKDPPRPLEQQNGGRGEGGQDEGSVVHEKEAAGQLRAPSQQLSLPPPPPPLPPPHEMQWSPSVSPPHQGGFEEPHDWEPPVSIDSPQGFVREDGVSMSISASPPPPLPPLQPLLLPVDSSQEDAPPPTASEVLGSPATPPPLPPPTLPLSSSLPPPLPPPGGTEESDTTPPLPSSGGTEELDVMPPLLSCGGTGGPDVMPPLPSSGGTDDIDGRPPLPPSQSISPAATDAERSKDCNHCGKVPREDTPPPLPPPLLAGGEVGASGAVGPAAGSQLPLPPPSVSMRTGWSAAQIRPDRRRRRHRRRGPPPPHACLSSSERGLHQTASTQDPLLSLITATLFARGDGRMFLLLQCMSMKVALLANQKLSTAACYCPTTAQVEA